MSKIVGFASYKGGTGKTTLTVASIKNLSEKGKKILIVDLDSNLSITSVFKMEFKDRTSIQLLNGEKVEPYRINDNIDIIPSDMRISKMSNLSDNTLRRALMKMDLSKYDYVFVDPPGAMSALSRNVLKAAELVVIPAMPSDIDLKATSYVIEEMEEMELESDVHVVLNGNDPRKNLVGIFERFKDSYDDFLYPHPISAMKSLKSLTSNVLKYNLTGIAKRYIDRFVSEVVV